MSLYTYKLVVSDGKKVDERVPVSVKVRGEGDSIVMSVEVLDDKGDVMRRPFMTLTRTGCLQLERLPSILPLFTLDGEGCMVVLRPTGAAMNPALSVYAWPRPRCEDEGAK